MSHDTDIAVRSFMAEHGMTRNELAKFLEDAVKWRILDQTITQARAGFADLPPEAVEALVDEAVAAVRQARKQPVPETH